MVFNYVVRCISLLLVPEHFPYISPGHGACPGCVDDLRRRDPQFLCPMCQAKVVRVDRNLQLMNMLEYLANKRKVEKSDSETRLDQMNKKLAEKDSEVQNLTQQMKQLEIDRNETLEQTREEMNRLQREMTAINQKKEELAHLLSQEESSHRTEIVDLQGKIADMESHLRVTQAKYQQAEQQERYLEEMRVQEPLSASSVVSGLQATLTWGDSFMKLLWGRPKSPLIEPLSAYTLQERRGKNRKTSRVRAASHRRDKVALKEFQYDPARVFPGSLLASTVDMIYLTVEQRNENAEKMALVQAQTITDLMREPMLLSLFQHCPRINSLRKIVQPPTRGSFFVELPFLKEDLEAALEEQTSSLEMPLEQMVGYTEKQILYHIITAVDFLHSAGVVHRDLQPAAVLIDRAGAQVCGFKNAISMATLRKMNRRNDPFIPTDRRFLAPEVLELGHEVVSSYHWASVDMWAVGCLMAYLFGRRSLFQSARSPEQYLEQIKRVCHAQEWESLLHDDADAKNLLSRLLHWDPTQRLSAKEALLHHYFDDLRGPPPRPGEIPHSEQCEDSQIIPFFNALSL